MFVYIHLLYNNNIYIVHVGHEVRICLLIRFLWLPIMLELGVWLHTILQKCRSWGQNLSAHVKHCLIFIFTSWTVFVSCTSTYIYWSWSWISMINLCLHLVVCLQVYIL